MLLKAGDQEYTAHFRHLEIWDEELCADRHETWCTLHQGRCIRGVLPGCGSSPRWFGEGFCHPNDQFSKRAGRKIALGRALKGLPRDLRKQLWESYFAISPIRGGV